MEHSTLDPSDLDRPDWNSLVKNYDKHDIGEAYFVGRMHQIGLHVEHWGIDKRHHDDHLIFDNKMDLRLWEPLDEQDESPPDWPDDPTENTIEEDWELGFDTVERRWRLAGIVDVKTKANSDWMGKFNLRHLAHYAEHSAHNDVPTFVFMTMVDTDSQQVGEENMLFPITTDWDWAHLCGHYDDKTNVDLSYGELKDTARECDIVDHTFRAPDGNLVVSVDDSVVENFDWFVEKVLSG